MVRLAHPAVPLTSSLIVLSCFPRCISWDGLTGSCQLSPAQFKESPMCSAAHRQLWDNRRSDYALKCQLGPSFKMNCAVADSCSGGQLEEDHQTKYELTYDCRKCDRGSDTWRRLPCCKTCLEAKQQGILVPGKDSNFSVVCEGCDDLQSLREQYAKQGRSNFCRLEGGRFDCSFSHSCELGDNDTTLQEIQCTRMPCDQCDPHSPMKAECCSLCLERACSSDSRHACTGCDATQSLTDGLMATPEGSRTTSLSAPANAGSTFLDVESVAELDIDDEVEIFGSGYSETRTIVGFGTIMLDSPLEHSYPAGSPVTKRDPVQVLMLGSQRGGTSQSRWMTSWRTLICVSCLACLLAGTTAAYCEGLRRMKPRGVASRHESRASDEELPRLLKGPTVDAHK